MKKWKSLIALLTVPALLILLWMGKAYIRPNRPSETEYPVRGVDVSHYQGEIDFSHLEQQGMRFAFIKATEGSSYVDDMLERNLSAVQESGMRFGFYHFFSFDSPGTTQAQNFIANVPVTENMLPPVIDVEFYGDYNLFIAPDAAAVIVQIRDMVEALEWHYGVKPVIYCTLSAYHKYIKGSFEDCDLWLRNVWWEPDLDQTFWQFTDRAQLEGYDGAEKYIDMNVFCGTEEAFLNYQ